MYLAQISRMGQVLPITPDLVVQVGDTVTLHGAERDVRRVASAVGEVIVPSDKTDFVYLGAGLVVGLLIGLLERQAGRHSADAGQRRRCAAVGPAVRLVPRAGADLRRVPHRRACSS